MSLIDKKTYPTYQEGLDQISSLGSTSGFEQSEGLTPIRGTPIIVRQLNQIQYLLVSLHQKVDALTTRVRAIETAKGADFSKQLEGITSSLVY